METWSTHALYQEASATSSHEAAIQLQLYAQSLISRGVAVVFSLRHLSKITSADYEMLRDTIKRKRDSANYRMYAISKRSGGRRFIHAVSGELFRVQQFINQLILQRCTPHSASFAFHASGGIRECAAMHCRARWLFQFDLSNFFYDVTEIDVYNIFRALGYRPLLSFELARLCTTTHLPKGLKRLLLHEGEDSPGFWIQKDESERHASHFPYANRTRILGVLPQGAPTSPMLSNLAARQLDEHLHSYSLQNGLIYTRYADDITLSASYLASPRLLGAIRGQVVHLIRKNGFKENSKKTRIAGPGSKKTVLGLLVDGDRPRISRETYHRIDRHLYAAAKFGVEATAAHEKFESAYGFVNHISGLIAFIKDVDENRWHEFSGRFDAIHSRWFEGS